MSSKVHDVDMEEDAPVVEDAVDIAYKKSLASLQLAQRLFECGTLQASGSSADAAAAKASILAEVEKNCAL